MKNCLEQFFPVEERPDGVYIKVSRSDRERIDTDGVIRLVDGALVMNFDVVKFKDIYSRARGVFEKVGTPFEYYDNDLDEFISCTVTPLKANIKISERYLLKGKKPTTEQLIYYLKRKGVVHGIDTPMLARIGSEHIYDKHVDIATATPPQTGTDASIEIRVAISSEAKPELRSDGSVDYRNIKTFTPVAKGDLLAAKHPPLPGRPGTTVTGEPIPSEPGKDVSFPNGRNTEISPDGLQLLATTTGIIFYDKGLLAIAELLHVGSDVDYSVGNIKYTGDILIEGGIKPGFTVEAEGSIHIKGEVESAKITSRAGSVLIEKGIVGKGDTVISAKNGIKCCFAQDAELRSESTVTFEKYLMHCKVTCGSMEAAGHQCSIIGGEIKAERIINIGTCGSEKGIATKLTIFDKNSVLIVGKIKELNDLHKKLTAELEPIERQLRTKAALMKRVGEEITDRQREEVKKWVDAYNAMKKKIDYVNQKIAELKKALSNPVDREGCIQIHEHCFPGTTLSLYDVTFPVTLIYANKRFRLKNQNVIIEGLSNHEQPAK